MITSNVIEEIQPVRAYMHKHLLFTLAVFFS